MQDAEDFNSFSLHPVNSDERRAADNQFSGPLHATFAAHEWVLCQHIRLTLDRLIQPDGRGGIICSNVVELVEPVERRGPEPANDQNGAFSELDELLSQAARWTALCRFTCSCEFHSASGLSASRTACSTS